MQYKQWTQGKALASLLYHVEIYKITATQSFSSTNTDISYLLNLSVKNSFRLKTGQKHEWRIQKRKKYKKPVKMSDLTRSQRIQITISFFFVSNWKFF